MFSFFYFISHLASGSVFYSNCIDPIQPPHGNATACYLKNLSKDEFSSYLTPFVHMAILELNETQRANISNISIESITHRNYDFLHSNATIIFNDNSNTHDDSRISKACLESVGVGIAEGMSVFVSMAGIPAKLETAIAQQLMEHMSDETVIALEALINTLVAAGSTWGKVKAFGSLIAGFLSLIGSSAIWDALKHSMHWWDWLYAGLVIMAQIIAWFATDLLAFVAEFAMFIINDIQLGIGIANIITECRSIAGHIEL